MISVAYRSMGSKKGCPLYEMMDSLAKEAYENIRFVDLTGRDLMALRDNPDKHIFDVVSGQVETTIDVGDGVKLNLPEQSILFYSHKPFNDFYSMLREGNYQLNSIGLMHVGALFTRPTCTEHYDTPIAKWNVHKIPTPEKFLKYLRKCRLTSRLATVVLFNPDEPRFIKGSHKPFMKKLLKDLEEYQELRRI
jgi:hypothetical protein